LISWGCWAVGLGLTHQLARRSLPGLPALVVLLTFALSPAVLLISANCYVETLLLMNVAGILLWTCATATSAEHLSDEASGGVQRFPVVLGVLAGGAAAVKLTGLSVLALPLIFALSDAGRATSRAGALRIALAAMLIAACVALPFYLRPWLATGNPFYPYFGEWFSSDPARVEMSRYHHAIGDAFGARGPASVVTGPILLAFEDVLYDGTFGWQLLLWEALALVALGAAVRRGDVRSAGGLAAAAAYLYVFWAGTAQQARFAVPAMSALVGLSSLAWPSLGKRWRKLVLASLAGATLVSLPWKTAGYYFGSWETLLGVWTRTEILDDATEGEYVPLVAAIRDLTPTDARLLLLFEHRGLYLPRANRIGTPFFQETGPLVDPSSDPADLHRRLRGAGITHVVLSRAPSGPDRAPAWQARFQPLMIRLEDCLSQDRLRVVWESPTRAILEVR
jgi:hypothetical protein